MPEPKPSLLLTEPADFSPDVLAFLRSRVDVELGPCGTRALRSAFSSYDAVWVRLAHRIDASVIGKAERCRFVCSPTTGLDHIDLEACADNGVEVLSLRGETGFLREVRATAELALGLAIALIRRIPGAARHVEAGGWDRDLFRGSELYRKTAGIVGVGRLGSIVGGYLSALGMEVIGYDTSTFHAPNITSVGSLGELVERSDLVSIHVPYGDSTRQLFDEAIFRKMKRGAVLVNTSRGGVVDEAALLDSLRTGHLGGAALDVLSGEPEVGANELVKYARQCENVLIVPHIGGNTYESFEKTELFLARKLLAALEVL